VGTVTFQLILINKGENDQGVVFGWQQQEPTLAWDIESLPRLNDHFDLVTLKEQRAKEVYADDGSFTMETSWERKVYKQLIPVRDLCPELFPKDEPEAESYKGKGLPYYIVRVMRYNPVFAIVDAICHEEEFETGRKRTGGERVMTAFGGVADIVTLGEASVVTSSLWAAGTTASMAADLDLIPKWTAQLVNVVTGLKLTAGAMDAWQKGLKPGGVLTMAIERAWKSKVNVGLDLLTISTPLVEEYLDSCIKEGSFTESGKAMVMNGLKVAGTLPLD
jgi:hypothetical protein